MDENFTLYIGCALCMYMYLVLSLSNESELILSIYSPALSQILTNLLYSLYVYISLSTNVFQLNLFE